MERQRRPLAVRFEFGGRSVSFRGDIRGGRPPHVVLEVGVQFVPNASPAGFVQLAVVSTFALLDGSGQLENRDYQISSDMPAACLGDVCRLGLHVLANGVISRCGRSAVSQLPLEPSFIHCECFTLAEDNRPLDHICNSRTLPGHAYV